MRNSVFRSSGLPFFLVVVLLWPLHSEQSRSELLVGQTEGNIERLVVGLENQVLQGYVQKNRETVAPLIADDFQDVGEYGVWDKERSLQEIADPTSLTQSLSMSQVHFARLAPTVVLLTYRLAEIEMDHGMAVPSTKYISSVWVHRDGRWLNVLGQETPATSTPSSARPSDSVNGRETGLSVQALAKEQEIQELQKRNDWQKIADFLSEDLVAIDEDGIHTKKEFLDTVKTADIHFSDYKMEDVRTIPEGNGAIVAYKQTLVGTEHGKPFTWRIFTHSHWVRRGDKWFLTMFQDSSAKE